MIFVIAFLSALSIYSLFELGCKQKFVGWKPMCLKLIVNLVMCCIFHLSFIYLLHFSQPPLLFHGSGLPSSVAVTKEERLSIESLQDYIQELKLQLRGANNQIKQLSEQLEQKSKEADRLRKTAYLNKRSNVSTLGRVDQPSVLEIIPGKNHTFKSGRPDSSIPSRNDEYVDTGLLEVARNLKQR